MPSPLSEFAPLFDPMKEKALKVLADEGFTGDKVILDWSVDLRYSRQVHEVTTPLKSILPLTKKALKDFHMISKLCMRENMERVRPFARPALK